MNQENIRILNVSKDTTGCHLKLKITLPDGSAVIRWGIEEMDYKRLRDILSSNYFDSLEVHYHYELLTFIGVSLDKPKGEKKFIASLRCVQGQKVAKIEFECSERFAGNMEWFRQEVRSLEDLESLRWEKLK